MKTYQMSKKLLTRLAVALDASVYRLCWIRHWHPATGYSDYIAEYVHVYQMDYDVSSKTKDCRLVLKSGKELDICLGQALKLDGKFVTPDELVEAFCAKLLK